MELLQADRFSAGLPETVAVWGRGRVGGLLLPERGVLQ